MEVRVAGNLNSLYGGHLSKADSSFGPEVCIALYNCIALHCISELDRPATGQANPEELAGTFLRSTGHVLCQNIYSNDDHNVR